MDTSLLSAGVLTCVGGYMHICNPSRYSALNSVLPPRPHLWKVLVNSLLIKIRKPRRRFASCGCIFLSGRTGSAAAMGGGQPKVRAF